LPIVGYEADWIRELAFSKGAWANIPPKSNRNKSICFSPYRYRARKIGSPVCLAPSTASSMQNRHTVRL